ncbi:MAG: alpha-amylase, partial [Pedobacter sp.]|nr:alpha-amylase [Pedobacter sp.]
MKKILNLLLIVVALFAACKKGGAGSTDQPVTPVMPPPVNLELPTGAKDGVAFVNNGTSAIITLYAPGKKSVSVIGEFNEWSASANAMKNTSDGKTWFVQIDNLDPNKEYAYQFLVDGTLKVADPYCEKVLDPDNDKYISATTYPNLKAYPTGKTTGIVSVMQANQPTYNWKN